MTRLAEGTLAVQRLLKKSLIRECAQNAILALQAGDSDQITALFEPGAHISHGAFDGTSEQFADWCRRERNRLAVTRYCTTSHLVTLGEDTAVAETYVLIVSSSLDRTVQVLSGGRFVDLVRESAGHWLIADRVLLMEWSFSPPTAEAVVDP